MVVVRTAVVVVVAFVVVVWGSGQGLWIASVVPCWRRWGRVQVQRWPSLVGRSLHELEGSAVSPSARGTAMTIAFLLLE